MYKVTTIFTIFNSFIVFHKKPDYGTIFCYIWELVISTKILCFCHSVLEPEVEIYIFLIIVIVDFTAKENTTMWLSKFSNQVELSVYYFNLTRLHLLKSKKNKTLSNILIDIYCILPAAIKLIQFDMCFYISWRFHCFFFFVFFLNFTFSSLPFLNVVKCLVLFEDKII